LDESGLSSALNWYVQGLKERSGLDVDLRIPEGFGRLPADVELVIFRIVQESITNVHRHSGSKSASIRVAREVDRVIVEVQDKGRGMLPEKLAEIQTQGSGVGISGIRERLRHFGGELIVDSNGSGTKVYAILPLPTPLSWPKSSTEQVVA
jgi:signal transduction histidine kinase